MRRVLQLISISVSCAMLAGCIALAAGAGATGGLAVGAETSHKTEAPATAPAVPAPEQ